MSSLANNTCVLAADKTASNSDPQKFPVKIYAMKDGMTNGVCVNSENGQKYRPIYYNVEKFIHTFQGKPLLCALINGRVDEYRSQHNGFKERNFSGPDSERIHGRVFENSTGTQMETAFGARWGVVNAYIDSFYGHALVDELKKGPMPVSVETTADEGGVEWNDSDMTAHWHEWTGLGITLMGRYVKPAISGAHSMAASEDEREEWMDVYDALVASNAEEEPDKPDEPTAFKKDELDNKKKDDECSSTETSAIEEPATENQEPKNPAADDAAFSNTKNATEGGIVRMGKSKSQLKRDLQARFKDHDVIGGCADGSVSVVFGRNSGHLLQYIANDAEDNGVFNEKRLAPLAPMVTCTLANGEMFECEFDEAVSPILAGLASVSAMLEGKDAVITSANEKVMAAEAAMAAMTAERDSERVERCKNAVNALVSEDTDGLVSVENLNALMAEIDAGKYNASSSVVNGKWDGATMVVNAYNALYGAASRERDKIQAENLRQRGGSGIWPDMIGKNITVGDMDARINKLIGGKA